MPLWGFMLRGCSGRLVDSIVDFPGSFQKFIDNIKAAQSDVDAAARLIDADGMPILSAVFLWSYFA
jgi:hypothetical protein